MHHFFIKCINFGGFLKIKVIDDRSKEIITELHLDGFAIYIKVFKKYIHEDFSDGF